MARAPWVFSSHINTQGKLQPRVKAKVTEGRTEGQTLRSRERLTFTAMPQTHLALQGQALGLVPRRMFPNAQDEIQNMDESSNKNVVNTIWETD